MKNEYFQLNVSERNVRGIISYPDDFDESNKYPVVFILYGMAGSRSEFKVVGISRELPRAGCICVKFDYSGLGTSDGYFFQSNFKTKSEDAIEVFRFISKKTFVDQNRIFTLTLSDGAQTALYMANNYKEFLNQNIIFWNPFIVENNPENRKKTLVRPRKAIDGKTLVVPLYAMWISLSLLSEKKNIDFGSYVKCLKNCNGKIQYLYASDDTEIIISKELLINNGFGHGIEVGIGGHRLYNPYTMREIVSKTIQLIRDSGGDRDDK